MASCAAYCCIGDSASPFTADIDLSFKSNALILLLLLVSKLDGAEDGSEERERASGAKASEGSCSGESRPIAEFARVLKIS